VDYALLNRLIEGGNGLSEDQVGAGLIAFRQSLAQLPQSAAQPGGVGAVADASFLSLTGAFQRRKMVCHVCFVTFVSLAGCSDYR
jgi:hypothetical protein